MSRTSESGRGHHRRSSTELHWRRRTMPCRGSFEYLCRRMNDPNRNWHSLYTSNPVTVPSQEPRLSALQPAPPQQESSVAPERYENSQTETYAPHHFGGTIAGLAARSARTSQRAIKRHLPYINLTDALLARATSSIENSVVKTQPPLCSRCARRAAQTGTKYSQTVSIEICDPMSPLHCGISIRVMSALGH